MEAGVKAHGVERVRGRCGGRPVVEGTRLPTATLYGAFMHGWSLRNIARQYPMATKAQVESALRFEMCRRCRCVNCAWAREIANARFRRAP